MNPSTQRLILIATVTLMVLFVVGNFLINHLEPTNSYSLKTTNQPTIGNLKSNVEVVVFLDPKCQNCKVFNNDLFPRIQKDYINTNKIRYTVIPVSYVNSSMTATEALLCTFYQDENQPNSKLFFSFLNFLYLYPPTTDNDWNNIDYLMALAKQADRQIDVDKIKKCALRHVYFTKIKQNTAEAARVTSNELSLPAVFVNGVKIDVKNSENIIKAIDKAFSNN